MINSTGIGYICLTIIVVFAMSKCGTQIDPKETAAIAEACAKVGKEPSIIARPGNGFSMGCVGQPASATTR